MIVIIPFALFAFSACRLGLQTSRANLQETLEARPVRFPNLPGPAQLKWTNSIRHTLRGLQTSRASAQSMESEVKAWQQMADLWRMLAETKSSPEVAKREILAERWVDVSKAARSRAHQASRMATLAAAENSVSAQEAWTLALRAWDVASTYAQRAAAEPGWEAARAAASMVEQASRSTVEGAKAANSMEVSSSWESVAAAWLTSVDFMEREGTAQAESIAEAAFDRSWKDLEPIQKQWLDVAERWQAAAAYANQPGTRFEKDIAQLMIKTVNIAKRQQQAANESQGMKETASVWTAVEEAWNEAAKFSRAWVEASDGPSTSKEWMDQDPWGGVAPSTRGAVQQGWTAAAVAKVAAAARATQKTFNEAEVKLVASEWSRTVTLYEELSQGLGLAREQWPPAIFSGEPPPGSNSAIESGRGRETTETSYGPEGGVAKISPASNFATAVDGIGGSTENLSSPDPVVEKGRGVAPGRDSVVGSGRGGGAGRAEGGRARRGAARGAG